MSIDPVVAPHMVWLAIDGHGAIHGPFAMLSGKGGFVFYAAERTLAEPCALLLVENGKPGPVRDTALFALNDAITRITPNE